MIPDKFRLPPVLLIVTGRKEPFALEPPPVRVWSVEPVIFKAVVPPAKLVSKVILPLASMFPELTVPVPKVKSPVMFMVEPESIVVAPVLLKSTLL